ncbi:MAG TPA: hypothetical protein VEX86_02970 [Longimicrobium sp.]|nr:hypothetical protein [Longimicrobium sp.]
MSVLPGPPSLELIPCTIAPASTVTEPVWPGAPVTAGLLRTPPPPNEIFVFGGNRDGFPGDGGAGSACRGGGANPWRQDPWIKRATSVRPRCCADVL